MLGCWQAVGCSNLRLAGLLPLLQQLREVPILLAPQQPRTVQIFQVRHLASRCMGRSRWLLLLLRKLLMQLLLQAEAWEGHTAHRGVLPRLWQAWGCLWVPESGTVSLLLLVLGHDSRARSAQLQLLGVTRLLDLRAGLSWQAARPR